MQRGLRVALACNAGREWRSHATRDMGGARVQCKLRGVAHVSIGISRTAAHMKTRSALIVNDYASQRVRRGVFRLGSLFKGARLGDE